ncbi:MAG: nitrate reductase subunit alpha, partial [Pirellulaceae bacterium]
MSLIRDAIAWIRDDVSPQGRQWEEFYRNRWQHDKVVRSTHGVNCTGGCTWNIHVKDGIVTWEMQGLDYPKLDAGLPPYEPRGCQRGISFSWYLYSPLRVKYPYIRGALLDLWKEVRANHADPVEAWKSLVENPDARQRWQRARGKGGLRRTDWKTAVEIIAASMVHTIRKHGPDRIAGFSPIPAMSMVSYASGARLLQLIGGVSLSFYDWYCDLPPASPETWGEQTDVAESADWYHAKLLVSMGANIGMTRTPDCHFLAEGRHNGTKLWVFSPDFNMVAKYADEWVALNAGQDGAWWMAVNHVLLTEFHHRKQTPYFIEYAKKFTDSPCLVEIVQGADGVDRPGQLLRAGRLNKYASQEHGQWKFLVWDVATQEPKMPMGSSGFRWGSDKGKWNLLLKDGADGSPIAPELTFLDQNSGIAQVQFDDFGNAGTHQRGVPYQEIEAADGTRVRVATVYDLLMAQYGVNRGLPGDYPPDYNDEQAPFTPAWSEKYTGIGREVLIRFAREWATTGEHTQGKCTILIGAGINHWYHANLMYRAGIHALIFCGCVGVNGGGLAHYVGQEKLAPMESWSSIALAKDWYPPSRLQNAPSWHYVHTDQWRYERDFTEYNTVPQAAGISTSAQGHTMDMQVRAVRQGWLPFYPQFPENPLTVPRQARAAGARTQEEIATWVAKRLQSREMQFSVEDPDAEANWPRVWFIWRGNALMASAKGHEYFLRHYLGTHDNALGQDMAAGSVKEVKWHENAPHGKMDLVVDLNFRMDSSALYSDIILPAATWYEKADLNSTDMHSFIHPLSQAVPPCWESKSDWAIFKEVAKKFSELAAPHFPEPVEDLVAAPLAHDTPAEIAQPDMKQWIKGEGPAIPGKTMPAFRVVSRNYKDVYRQFISYGPLARENGIGAHGTSYSIQDEYDAYLQTHRTETWNGETYPSLDRDIDVCDVILNFASVTNGELAYRSYQNMEQKTGLPLTHLAEKARSFRTSYADIQSQPRRFINSPMWSGLIENGRSYSPFTYNVETNVPWRTLTGRQSLYLDHPVYIDFGEHLPTYKPRPLPTQYADLQFTESGDQVGPVLMLNYLTPHG